MRIRIPDLTTKFCNNILGEESDQHVLISDPTRHANQTKNKLDNTKHSTKFDEFLHALLPCYVYEVPREL